MVVKNAKFYLYGYEHPSDILLVDENTLLKRLHEEAVLCTKNEHTEDELTAAISMMLMHYQVVEETQNIRPINTDPEIYSPHDDHRSVTNPQSLTRSLHGVQKTNADTMKQQDRRNRKSNSILLASCRNILKEFLSQNL